MNSLRTLFNLPSRLLWRVRIQRWGVGYPDPEMHFLSGLCSPRKISIDVGASLGLYTIHLLAHSQRVVAFEPRTGAACALEKLYDRSAVEVHSVALSDHNDDATMTICHNDLGRSTLEKDNPVAGTQEIVSVRTLDSFALQDVGFIKIDVEGHELAVLNGSIATIRRERPNLLIEIEERHKRGSTKEVPALMHELGYSAWYLRNQKWRPFSTFDHEFHQRIGTEPYINNFVFVPTEIEIFLKPKNY